MPEEEKRHSKVRKTISRKIQTDNFESVDVYVSSEEWIEWDTEKERATKTSKFTQVLIDDFIDSFNRTVSALNVDRLIGQGKTYNGKVAKVKERQENKETIEEDDKIDKSVDKNVDKKLVSTEEDDYDDFDLLGD